MTTYLDGIEADVLMTLAKKSRSFIAGRLGRFAGKENTPWLRAAMMEEVGQALADAPVTKILSRVKIAHMMHYIGFTENAELEAVLKEAQAELEKLP